MPAPYPPKLTLEATVPSAFDQDSADRVSMVGTVIYPGSVNSVQFVPGWTLAGADTNYRTLSLYNRGSAGAGTTKIAELALTSGVNLTKFVPKDITLQAAANLVVAPGDILQWVTTVSGAGAADAGGRVIVKQSHNP